MHRLAVTKYQHPSVGEYVIIHAEKYQLQEYFGDILNEIFLMEGLKTTYAFFQGRIIIISNEKKSAEVEVEIVGKFANLPKPDVPKTYNMYRFDPGEHNTSFEFVLNITPGPNNVKIISKALDLYFGLFRMFAPIDVIFNEDAMTRSETRGDDDPKKDDSESE